MKICALSDMHGQLNVKVEPCDIVIICGDIIPLGIQRFMTASQMWIEDTFIKWCNNLPCEHVFFIGGNHDFFLEEFNDKVKEIFSKEEKITYLNCEFAEYNGKTIYGTPLCHKFYDWAFMPPDKEQDKIFKKALKEGKKIDILMAHDAPYGTSDVLLQKDCPWANGEHIGSEPLKKFVEKAQPTLVLHGHLHSTNHEKEMLGDSEVYNVSLLDENYRMVYNPQYFTI